MANIVITPEPLKWIRGGQRFTVWQGYVMDVDTHELYTPEETALLLTAICAELPEGSDLRGVQWQ